MNRNAADGSLEAIVGRWDADRVFEIKNSLERLEETPGWIEIIELIGEARENATDRLVRGPTLEQADYARALGMLAGLEVLERIPHVIKSRAEAWERKIERRDEELAARRSGNAARG